jgi:plasmid stability protein
MAVTILQVRDVDAEVVKKLKSRAEARGMSLSAYVRALLAEEAALPSPDEVTARIAEREPVSVTSADVRELIAQDRRW